MSSYQIPVKRNNEFSTIFNSLDYDVNALSKSNPVLFNDSRYLQSSGSNVTSNAINTSFNTLAISTLKAKQNIDTFSITTFASMMTFNFTVNMIYYLEINSLTNSFLFFTNIPTTPQQSYIFTFLIKPTVNSKFYMNPINNLISINGVLNTPIYGSSNVSLPTTFNFIVQQITIINTSSTSTPSFIGLTSVSAY